MCLPTHCVQAWGLNELAMCLSSCIFHNGFRCNTSGNVKCYTGSQALGHVLQGKMISLHIDNQAVVHSLKFGKTKDKVLQSIVRKIWLLAAPHDIQLNYSHIPGILNKEANVLSRVFQHPSEYSLFLLHNCVCWPVNGGWCVPTMFL